MGESPVYRPAVARAVRPGRHTARVPEHRASRPRASCGLRHRHRARARRHAETRSPAPSDRSRSSATSTSPPTRRDRLRRDPADLRPPAAVVSARSSDASSIADLAMRFNGERRHDAGATSDASRSQAAATTRCGSSRSTRPGRRRRRHAPPNGPRRPVPRSTRDRIPPNYTAARCAKRNGVSRNSLGARSASRAAGHGAVSRPQAATGASSASGRSRRAAAGYSRAASMPHRRVGADAVRTQGGMMAEQEAVVDCDDRTETSTEPAEGAGRSTRRRRSARWADAARRARSLAARADWTRAATPAVPTRPAGRPTGRRSGPARIDVGPGVARLARAARGLGGGLAVVCVVAEKVVDLAVERDGEAL